MIAQHYADSTRTHEVSKSGSRPVGYPAPSLGVYGSGGAFLSASQAIQKPILDTTKDALGDCKLLKTGLRSRGEISIPPNLSDRGNHCNAIGVEISLQLCMFSGTL